MNLADIRKKAQRERQEQDKVAAGRVPVVPLEACPLPNTPTPELRHSLQPSSGLDRTLTPIEPFDPLGVILAGREAVRAALLCEVAPELAAEEELAGFLVFMVGGENYAVEIDRVRETLRPRRVTPVPRAPESITGIISHRGAIISVLDLTGRLCLDMSSPAGAGRIIVVRKGSGFCGLLVDRVDRVVMLQPSAIEPLPAGSVGENREFVSGIVRHRGAMLILLNLDKVLDIGLRST